MFIFSELFKKTGFTKKFLTEFYSRIGNEENGDWIYHTQPCLQEFRQNHSPSPLLVSVYRSHNVA
jgi:hypothetical protein